MQATGAIGDQKFLLFIGLAIDGRDQVFPGVLDPDLIVTVYFLNADAER